MEIKIKTDTIKIGQLLKYLNKIDNGSDAKYFLEENKVEINGVKPQGRASKVKIGDKVLIGKSSYSIKKDDSNKKSSFPGIYY